MKIFATLALVITSTLPVYADVFCLGKSEYKISKIEAPIIKRDFSFNFMSCPFKVENKEVFFQHCKNLPASRIESLTFKEKVTEDFMQKNILKRFLPDVPQWAIGSVLFGGSILAAQLRTRINPASRLDVNEHVANSNSFSISSNKMKLPRSSKFTIELKF